MMEDFRPKASEMKPDARAPSQEPPGMEAEMPPCVLAVGPEH